MSDLQCAARFVVVTDPGATARLGHERVAAVYDARPNGHHETARELLGLAVQVVGPLTLRGVLDRAPQALETLRELADLHRGETVVVLSEGAAGGRVDVSLDGDGVVVRQVSPEGGT